MISFIIICVGLAGHGGGSSTFASAAAVPSPGSSAHWRGGNESYLRNEDIPIMGDHFRPRSKNGTGPTGGKQRRRSKRSRKRHRDDDAYDMSDDGDDDPPPFFLDQDDDDDQWRDQHEYDRQRRRQRQRINQKNNQPLDSFRRWALDKTGVHIPRVNLHFDPITTLKIRKSWHDIVPGAIIRIGADFETHRLGKGLWRLRGCIEDKLVGGRLTIKERKNGDDDRAVLMEYSKSWLFAGAGKRYTAYCLTTNRIIYICVIDSY